MNASDAFLDCARECARLSRECRDRRTADALFRVSARLFCAATRDAELVVDDSQVSLQPASQAGLFAGA